MRGIAGLFGATLMLLVLTTCGTYRAITDDYRSDKPVIQSVTPTSGFSGEEVTFKINFCESLQLKPTGSEEYIWNFGGGAEPNVSYDAEPAVTLRNGAISPYSASVTVSGGCVGDEALTSSFDFTISVATLEVHAVTPLTVRASTERQQVTASFSALVQGVATQYQWDFGSASMGTDESAEVPHVVITDKPGIYQCKVIVSNKFEAFEFPFTINVI
jgi:PKD repeat protein